MKKLLFLLSFITIEINGICQQKLQYSPLPSAQIKKDSLERRIVEFKRNGIVLICDAIPDNDYGINYSFLILRKKSIAIILFNRNDTSFISRAILPNLKKGQSYKDFYIENLYNNSDVITYDLLNKKTLEDYVKN